MFAIFKREVRSCFHGMIGYVLTAFLLVAHKTTPLPSPPQWLACSCPVPP